MANSLGRRRVLKGATATAALLSAARAALPSGAFAQAAGPETDKVKLGFIALTDASPLIVAKEKKLFDKVMVLHLNKLDILNIFRKNTIPILKNKKTD